MVIPYNILRVQFPTFRKKYLQSREKGLKNETANFLRMCTRTCVDGAPTICVICKHCSSSSLRKAWIFRFIIIWKITLINYIYWQRTCWTINPVCDADNANAPAPFKRKMLADEFSNFFSKKCIYSNIYCDMASVVSTVAPKDCTCRRTCGGWGAGEMANDFSCPVLFALSVMAWLGYKAVTHADTKHKPWRVYIYRVFLALP